MLFPCPPRVIVINKTKKSCPSNVCLWQRPSQCKSKGPQNRHQKALHHRLQQRCRTRCYSQRLLSRCRRVSNEANKRQQAKLDAASPPLSSPPMSFLCPLAPSSYAQTLKSHIFRRFCLAPKASPAQASSPALLILPSLGQSLTRLSLSLRRTNRQPAAAPNHASSSRERAP